MTSTKKIVAVLIVIFASVCSLVIYNAFYSFDRTFTLVHSDKYKICFLISNDYQFSVTRDGLIYRGFKNNGKFTIRTGGFSEGAVIRNMNGFKGAELKEKNFRNYEYQIFEDNEDLILVDRFEYVQKTPPHIFPGKLDCDTFKKKFKNKQVVFDE